MIRKIIGLLIIFTSIQNFAQRNNTSPYSFFGIGEETSQKTVEEISMGEIGAAFNSPFKLTFSNPASLASLRFTTYTLAIENKALSIDDGTNSESASAASLSYMAMGIPFGKKAGLLFGIQPNTTVGYSLLEQFKDSEGTITSLNLFTGEGGTNRVFLGFGYMLRKNLSIGFEAAYVFGSIDNNLLNRRDAVQLATMHQIKSELTGFTVKAGVQYNAKINEKLILKTGAVVNFDNDLKNNGKEYLFSLVNNSGGLIIPRDTIVNNSFESTVKIPLKTVLSAGVGQENKWYAGVEYSFQDALDGLLIQSNIVSYGSSNRISAGGFYTPKFNSISSYWQRITYRAGFNYKQTGLVVNNTSVNDFGISFGVGLPIGQQLSNINVGFELGTRGKKSEELIKENFFNFRLSLTLNDKWFRKRKLQ
ncbi:MAG TPA: hypothetical protein ENK46_04295 [Flavobacteriia bacterium]|nr:hypothetical protein [Flavobacteriia bacterium]